MVTIQAVDVSRSLVCLTLDSNQRVWLTSSDFSESGWHEGLSIEEAAFERFIQLHQYPRALNKAVAMLARRPCSKCEIIQNLNHHHYADEVIELVICKLEKENLLDDQEFSDLWVQHRVEKYGIRRIRQELLCKGISEETADEALSQVSDAQQLANAVAFAQKAWSRTKPGEDAYKSRQKIMASLIRKGYNWDIAKKATDTLMRTK